jgi:hypothetical protein
VKTLKVFEELTKEYSNDTNDTLRDQFSTKIGLCEIAEWDCLLEQTKTKRKRIEDYEIPPCEDEKITGAVEDVRKIMIEFLEIDEEETQATVDGDRDKSIELAPRYRTLQPMRLL